MLTHERTAVTAMVTAVLYAIGEGLTNGHVVWPAVWGAALTALAGVAGSALNVKKS